MLITLRRNYAEYITSGAQLTLLLIGFLLHMASGWIAVFGLIALISLIAWYAVLKRYRAIIGTPTSRIASAAQGYVELTGHGRSLGETQSISTLSRLPCLWHRYRIEREVEKHKWELVSSGESNDPFLLDDGSGTCIVDPAGAEILTQHKDTWREFQFRYTEWKLIPLDNLYLLGHFKTVGGSTLDRTLKEEMNNVLLEWKRDMPDLHRRFDLDGNGTLDMQEWQLARQAAKREAEKRLTELRNQADRHFLLQPQDGRLFLISNQEPNELARRYLFWSWAHIMILLTSLGGIGWSASLSW